MIGLIVALTYWACCLMTGLVYLFVCGMDIDESSAFKHIGFYIWVINPTVIGGVALLWSTS